MAWARLPFRITRLLRVIYVEKKFCRIRPRKVKRIKIVRTKCSKAGPIRPTPTRLITFKLVTTATEVADKTVCRVRTMTFRPRRFSRRSSRRRTRHRRHRPSESFKLKCMSTRSFARFVASIIWHKGLSPGSIQVQDHLPGLQQALIDIINLL